jgi:hypothetical protein
LFCFVLVSSRENWDASNCVLEIAFLLSLESSQGGGVHQLGFMALAWTCGVEVLEYWMISSLKIKLNPRWKFWRNWNVPLVLLERSRWAGFNGIYLVRFGFRMWWEILILKWFLPLKIQNKFPKNQVLEGKISWGRGNTWGQRHRPHLPSYYYYRRRS